MHSGVNNNCFNYEGISFTAKYQDHFSCSFDYKLVFVDDKYSKDIVLYRGKNAIYKFNKSIFNQYCYCKGAMKKNFNKKLIMSVEEE